MTTNIEKIEKITRPRNEMEQAEYDERRNRSVWGRNVAKIVATASYYMDQKSITQKELATRMGVSQAYITKLLHGKENLTMETVAKLEKALDEKIISIIEPYRQIETIRLVDNDINTSKFNWTLKCTTNNISDTFADSKKSA